MPIFKIKHKQEYHPTEAELIEGLQAHDRLAETFFNKTMSQYFNAHFNAIFFDISLRDEIFQTALIKLWTEIENKKIKVIEQQICRQQKDGSYKAMTANLRTFLMAFAKNEYREALRRTEDDDLDTIANDSKHSVIPSEPEESVDELKARLVDECLMQMSNQCIELIRLFYYEEKSLDEIMDLRNGRNSSKNGLKTAKSKCLNMLRNKIESKYTEYNIAV